MRQSKNEQEYYSLVWLFILHLKKTNKTITVHTKSKQKTCLDKTKTNFIT